MQITKRISKCNVFLFLLALSVSTLAGYTAAPALYAKTEALFSPGGSIQKTLIKNINSSTSTIDVMAFTFTAGEIAEALYIAKERGVEIRIVIDQRQDAKHYPVVEFLKDEEFNLQFLKGNIGGSMNNTFAIFDRKLLMTGSYRWTEYAEKFNYENAVFIDEPEVIEQYMREFEILYEKSVVQREQSLKKADGEKEVSDTDNVSRNKGGKELEEAVGSKAITFVAGTNKQFARAPVNDNLPKTVNLSQAQFTDISFHAFDELFGKQSELEKAERMRLWEEEYEGKYVTWTGRICFRGFAVYDWNKVGISHNSNNNIDVNLRFDWSKQRKVMQLKVGDIVTYTGKLVSLNSIFSAYRLEDVDVLQIR